MQKRLKSSFH